MLYLLLVTGYLVVVVVVVVVVVIVVVPWVQARLMQVTVLPHQEGPRTFTPLQPVTFCKSIDVFSAYVVRERRARVVTSQLTVVDSSKLIFSAVKSTEVCLLEPCYKPVRASGSLKSVEDDSEVAADHDDGLSVAYRTEDATSDNPLCPTLGSDDLEVESCATRSTAKLVKGAKASGRVPPEIMYSIFASSTCFTEEELEMFAVESLLRPFQEGTGYIAYFIDKIKW